MVCPSAVLALRGLACFQLRLHYAEDSGSLTAGVRIARNMHAGPCMQCMHVSCICNQKVYVIADTSQSVALVTLYMGATDTCRNAYSSVQQGLRLDCEKIASIGRILRDRHSMAKHRG